jgi:hypothetical protein
MIDSPITQSISDLEAHSHFSSLRERIVEHLFVGELLKYLWQHKRYGVEVSRAESDSFGYDIVIESGKVIRHIQLKSNMERPRNLSIARTLEKKPSGCVIWIGITIGLEMKEFGWYGSGPGLPLPDLSNFENSLRIGRNRDGKRPKRSNHVDVPFSKNFNVFRNIDEVASLLFG